MEMRPRLAFLATSLLVLLVRLSPECAAHVEEPLANPKWPASSTLPQHKPSLEYYVQVAAGPPYLPEPLVPLNQTSTFHLGGIQAFEFNVTEGASYYSKPLGNVRGYVVDCSFTSVRHQVEVEVLSYDDGNGVAGTISFHGLINHVATNVIAVVGGTGSFVGVRGNVVITMLELRRLYHHALFFSS